MSLQSSVICRMPPWSCGVYSFRSISQFCHVFGISKSILIVFRLAVSFDQVYTKDRIQWKNRRGEGWISCRGYDRCIVESWYRGIYVHAKYVLEQINIKMYRKGAKYTIICVKEWVRSRKRRDVLWPIDLGNVCIDCIAT